MLTSTLHGHLVPETGNTKAKRWGKKMRRVKQRLKTASRRSTVVVTGTRLTTISSRHSLMRLKQETNSQFLGYYQLNRNSFLLLKGSAAPNGRISIESE